MPSKQLPILVLLMCGFDFDHRMSFLHNEVKMMMIIVKEKRGNKAKNIQTKLQSRIAFMLSGLDGFKAQFLNYIPRKYYFCLSRYINIHVYFSCVFFIIRVIFVCFGTERISDFRIRYLQLTAHQNDQGRFYLFIMYCRYIY